jgi:hypothetical protein
MFFISYEPFGWDSFFSNSFFNSVPVPVLIIKSSSSQILSAFCLLSVLSFCSRSIRALYMGFFQPKKLRKSELKRVEKRV